jgi:hypothetical protein
MCGQIPTRTAGANVKKWWYRATHFTTIKKYDPPVLIPGSYFNVSGMMITGQRRWYKTTMRVLWGQSKKKDKWW